MDANMKQLLSRDNVSLALDGWTSTSKLDIPSANAYYMAQKLASREVQLAFDDVDCLFFSRVES